MTLTPKGRRTEAAFLEAAANVFADVGFLNAKIADIAAVAGRSTASFYNYFEKKEDLLDAMLEEFSVEVVAGSPVLDPDNAYASIRAAVRSYVEGYRRHLPEIIGLTHMAMTSEQYADRERQHRAVGIEKMCEGIEAANRTLERAPVVRPEILASTIVNAMEATCWTWLAGGGEKDIDPPDDDELVESLTILWHNAVFGPVPHRS